MSIPVTFRFEVEDVVELPLRYVAARFMEQLREHIYPTVQIGGAVVAVYHRDELARRRRHYVYLGIIALERALEHHHRENGRARRRVARARRNAVRRRHARSGVALRRRERDARLEISGRVKELRALGRQPAGVPARHDGAGQNV